MSKPTTGGYSVKPYRCTHCDHVSQEGTNHWGEIYSRCTECSWKRPLEATVKVCIEPMPEGHARPTPWKLVRLGDLVEVFGGKA